MPDHLRACRDTGETNSQEQVTQDNEGKDSCVFTISC